MNTGSMSADPLWKQHIDRRRGSLLEITWGIREDNHRIYYEGHVQEVSSPVIIEDSGSAYK